MPAIAIAGTMPISRRLPHDDIVGAHAQNDDSGERHAEYPPACSSLRR